VSTASLDATDTGRSYDTELVDERLKVGRYIDCAPSADSADFLAARFAGQPLPATCTG
jgi:hypothetical protein